MCHCLCWVSSYTTYTTLSKTSLSFFTEQWVSINITTYFIWYIVKIAALVEKFIFVCLSALSFVEYYEVLSLVIRTVMFPIQLNFTHYFFKFFDLFLYMSVLPVYMYLYHVCFWCPQRSEERIRFPGLELGMVVDQHVVLYESNRYF